jgi:predicted exporter
MRLRKVVDGFSGSVISVGSASEGSLVLLMIASALAVIGLVLLVIGAAMQRYGSSYGALVAVGIVLVFVLGNLGCMRIAGSNR